MRTNAFRGAAAAVLSIGLVTVPFTQAQAAPDPTPGHFTSAPITGLASHRAELPALKKLSPSARADALDLLKRSPSTSGLAASAEGIIEMSSFCPTGQSPYVVHSYESFEGQLPYPDQSIGFTVQAGPDAPDGASWAQSTHQTSDPAAEHWVVSNFAPVPQTGKVYLAFTYRGQYAGENVYVAINEDGGSLAANPDWATVALDITSEATTNGGFVDVHFDHQAGASTSEYFAVDDVAIYGCKATATPPPAPNSGVRGDWSGQGTVDLMATRGDGTLWMYEGAGTGALGRGVQVGNSWSTFTWQGSPGDINGDRRTDLLARRSDGTLWYYPGKGYGALGRGLQVGNGWNVMTSIATPGDFDRDGRPDLVARRSDGTLHLYRILPTGALRYVKAIGSGWNIMTSIIGMGDLNADKRGDLIARRTDGTMFSYLSTGTGLARGTTVSTGWNIMDKLTSPGDMNKDGRGDLIGRRTDGTLWFYAGRSGGGVLGGRQVGSGWNVMTNIL